MQCCQLLPTQPHPSLTQPHLAPPQRPHVYPGGVGRGQQQAEALPALIATLLPARGFRCEGAGEVGRELLVLGRHSRQLLVLAAEAGVRAGGHSARAVPGAGHRLGLRHAGI